MFFKIMLNVFYSSIIIENEELIPSDGTPTIICANHSNSVMDAVVLVTSVSRKVEKPRIPNRFPLPFAVVERD
jgi:glycerol-3-phosphate O-acyltransferase / dihydroxyacetone phosphate acyltransferase